MAIFTGLANSAIELFDLTSLPTPDTKFLEFSVYFFELVFPAEAVKSGLSAGATNSYLFPLLLNPESIKVEERFTVNKVGTSSGGLYVEENGILERMLVIRGHTGFRPRMGRTNATQTSVYPATTFKARQTYHSRGNPSTREALSGQRHFHFLQDKVFRTYGDLKRDPTYSEGTKLNWHNPHDEEHFRIIPEKFTMTRDVKRKFLYQYEIVASIVGKAESQEAITSPEDKSIFDAIQDGVHTVRSAIDNVNAAIADVGSFIFDIENTVHGIQGALNDVADIANSVSNVVGGIERLGTSIATVPFNTVRNATDALENLSQQVTGLPKRVEESVKQSMQNAGDAVDHFSFLPEIFEENALSKSRQDFKRIMNAARATRSQLEAAEANPPTTAQQAASLTGAPLPGDRLRLSSPLYPSPQPTQIKSASVQIVQGGDTLPNLSARYLADARRWRELATLNQLRAPYISLVGEPNTLKPGDQILIPSAAPVDNLTSPTPGIFPGKPNVPAEERSLGRDLKLVADRQGFYDFEIDSGEGNADFSEIAGIANLKQALVQRVSIEQGTDVLYRGLGYKRIVGIGSTGVDSDIARIRLSEAVLADPRITSLVKSALLTNDPIDAVQVRIEASVKGFSEPIQVTTPRPIPLNTI